MPELPATYERGSHSKSNTSRRKDRTGPGKPTGQVRCKVGIFPRCELVRPKVLTTCVRQRTSQLTERYGDTGGNQRNDYDAVDNEHGPAGVDTSYQGGGYTKPRVSEGEAYTQDRPHGEVALQVLGVAHLGQFQSIFIQAFLLRVVIGYGRFGDLFIDIHYGQYCELSCSGPTLRRTRT